MTLIDKRVWFPAAATAAMTTTVVQSTDTPTLAKIEFVSITSLFFSCTGDTQANWLISLMQDDDHDASAAIVALWLFCATKKEAHSQASCCRLPLKTTMAQQRQPPRRGRPSQCGT